MWNLLVGAGTTLLFAGLAVATVASGGAALAVVALAGAAVGTAAVTAGATYSDIKSGNSRSLGEFAGQLTMGAAIGFTTGASIYGLVTAIPAASAAMGSGTNVLVETVFDGDIQAYETATMCIDMLGMMYVQCGSDNAALGMNESEEQGGKGGKKGVYLEGESDNEFSAGVHPGKISAESQEVSRESIIRALRQSNTPEGSAVAKMLKRNIIKLNIRSSHPSGYAGLKPHGNNKIYIYVNATKTPQVAAGYTAHEAKHYLQKLMPSTYQKIHEFEAFSFQAQVDKTFPLKTSKEIWNFINTHPAYKKLK